MINRDVEEDDSGGLEYNVRRFSRMISYVSFFWRILLCLILERVSFDFLTIIKYKKTSVTQAESLEQNLATDLHAGKEQMFKGGCAFTCEEACPSRACVQHTNNGSGS